MSVNILFGRFVGCVNTAIVCMAILSTPITRAAESTPAEVKMVEIEKEDESTYSSVINWYNDTVQWPTDAERENDIATASEIEASIPAFEQFTRRVMSAKYIPADLRIHVIGLKKWSRRKVDVLFAEYDCNGAKIWVKDDPVSSTVKIVANRLAAHGDRWEPLIRDVCGEYLNDPKRLLSYTRLRIVHLEGTEIRRVGMTLPRPVRTKGAGGNPWWMPYSTDLWYSGNPYAIWLDGNTAIVEVWKRENEGEAPIGPNFGVSQRFPPLAEVIKDYSTEELLKYAASTKNEANRRIAWRLYRERHDHQTVIPLLISIYENAAKGDEELRMAVIQDLADLVAMRPGAYRDRVRELIVNDLADKERSGGMMGVILRKELDRLPPPMGNAPDVPLDPAP